MKKNKKVFAMNDDYGAEEGLISLDYALSEAGQEDAAAETPNRRDLSAQVDEVVQGLSGARVGAQVYLIDVRQLEPYPDQPFRQYLPDKLQELAEDIGRVGVLNPILTRRNGNRLQILAGHNRWAAANLAGLTHVPVIVMEADDDQAILVLTSTNLRQREQLAPSEKAYAYKLQMDALKRQGQRSREEYSASSYITRQTGESRVQIHRYVRLTELTPELLELLDRGKISMTSAVAISYLEVRDQEAVCRYLQEHGGSLSIEKANRLKRLAEERKALEPLPILEVLGRKREKEQPREKSSAAGGEEIRIPFERLREYLPEGIGVEDAVDVIVDVVRLRG